MFFSEYQRLAARTMNPVGGKFRIANWGLGLAGEAGEVVDLIKKGIFHKHGVDKVKLKEEVGDTLYYLAAICEEAGFYMGDVAAANIKKLQKRFPNGFTVEDSIKRIDTKEQ